MSTKKFSFKIVDGPNCHRLVDAFLYANDKECPGEDLCKLTIWINPDNCNVTPYTISGKVKLRQLAHESDSNYGFCFKGIFSRIVSGRRFEHEVEGYYDSRKREGELQSYERYL